MFRGRAAEVDVLTVCTGNVCRSPYAAARIASALPALRVESAGTGALVGDEPPAEVRSLIELAGVEAVDPVARDVTRALLKRSRLVLTAQRLHRVEVARMVPSAADRAFTFLELARLLDAAGRPTGLGVDGVVALAAEQPDDGRDHDDDLADPFGGPEEGYLAMARTTDAALAVVVPALQEPVGERA